MKTDNYTIKERTVYEGAHSRTKHFAIYRKSDDKCIAWDVTRQMAQRFMRTVLGYEDAAKTLKWLQKQSVKDPILKGVLDSKNLIAELKTLM